MRGARQHAASQQPRCGRYARKTAFDAADYSRRHVAAPPPEASASVAGSHAHADCRLPMITRSPMFDFAVHNARQQPPSIFAA